MKFILLLIVFISCGKHESPKALDLKDNDGDQIANEYEKDLLEKNVANVEPIGAVKGTMRFNHGKQILINFSNNYDLNKDTLTIMTGKDDDHLKNDYFDEWSKLYLEKSLPLKDLKVGVYTVYLDFQTSSSVPEEIFLVNEKANFKIGDWAPNMKVNLSSEDLMALLAGKAHFRIQKKFYQAAYQPHSSEQTIKEKTYRLFFLNKKKASVLYVSKDFSIDDLMKAIQIHSPALIHEDELFFLPQEETATRWHLRAFKNGDYALAQTSIAKIRETFLERFNYKKSLVSRKNGSPEKKINLSNKIDADIYLRIRATHTIRTFKEKSEKRNYSEGGGGGMNGNGVFRWSCVHYLREIKSENVIFPDLATIAENLQVDLSQSTKIEENMDERGIYWDIKLSEIEPNTVLSFLPREKNTYVTTGQYDVRCGTGKPRSNSASHKTNFEGQFLLEVESYVEKLP